MGNTSGLVIGLVGVADGLAGGNIQAIAVVSGAAISEFDSKLIVAETFFSEFDAKLCVGIQAEAVAPSAVIELPTTANSSGVPDFTVTFSGVGYASGSKRIVDYKWFFNDIDIAVSGGQVVTHTFSNSGSFLVTFRVMDDDGLYGFDTIRINTYSGISLDLPQLEISGTPQNGDAPLLVDFTAQSSGVAGTTILGYSWCFGHGLFSKRQNQNDIPFNVPGKYIPVCTIIDSRGVRMSDSVEIGANN